MCSKNLMKQIDNLLSAIKLLSISSKATLYLPYLPCGKIYPTVGKPPQAVVIRYPTRPAPLPARLFCPLSRKTVPVCLLFIGNHYLCVYDERGGGGDGKSGQRAVSVVRVLRRAERRAVGIIRGLRRSGQRAVLVVRVLRRSGQRAVLVVRVLRRSGQRAVLVVRGLRLPAWQAVLVVRGLELSEWHDVLRDLI